MDEDIKSLNELHKPQKHEIITALIQINLICMTKDEDMMSKIEVERIRPGHALKKSSKNERKINK